MPRVHFVKKARKSNKAYGIKKGESYYWWKFRHGGKRVSKKPPRPSQLTQSAFLSSFYSIEEAFSDATSGSIMPEDALSACEDAISELENLRDETQEKIDNMESAFPNGSPALETLQEYLEKAEEAIQSMEDVKGEIESIDDDLSDEEREEAVSSAVSNMSW